jgi:adenylate cyclase
VESRAPAAFEEWHEAYLEIIANQVAVAIENMTLREDETEEPPPPSVAVPRVETRRFRFFKSDDCVFTGDEYLVRNVPGRILWSILRAHKATGRSEFTNRELRLDASIGLPAIKDNLESRLVLLRKRLEEKCPDLRLVSTGRGRFRIEIDSPFELEELS